MNCARAQRSLPGYLDGAIPAAEHLELRRHLETCGPCREQLERYRLQAAYLARVEPVPPPADLALQIRLRASREQSPWSAAVQWWARAKVASRNIFEPFAVPATGGLLASLAVFALLVPGMLGGVPMGGVVPNDLPLNLVQPAELQSLAPFPVPGLVDVESRPNSGALLVEATLNAAGEVVYYKILSGPDDRDVQHQLDQLLLFSRFRPQLSFGRPTDGGRVLLSFSGIQVRG